MNIRFILFVIVIVLIGFYIGRNTRLLAGAPVIG